MKKRWLALLMSVGLCCYVAPIFMIGCTTNQQTITYKSLSTLEQTTTAAYDGYFDLVVQGKVTTNGVPAISKKFNQFQASMLVATDLVQGNTNALAPANLVIESQDLINLINTFRTTK